MEKYSIFDIFEISNRISNDIEILEKNRYLILHAFEWAKEYMSINEISEFLEWGKHYAEYVSGDRMSTLNLFIAANKLFLHIKETRMK